MKIKEGGVMDILNNSIVTDADTEVLDSQITQISNDFSETHYFDSEQEEELELLVAKAMKLGELYERKKWQAAKAQAVPAQLDVNSILHDIDCYFDSGLSNTERTANNLIQSIYEKLSGEIKAQEPAND